MIEEEQYDRGVARMKELFGEDYAATPMGDDFMDITIGYLFGDIWTRDGLELRERSMITCAVLTALGKELQLKTHLRGALHAGIDQKAVEEMMIHIAHYAGWPTAVNGLRVAREVFEELDA
jgi:4-carboxymuconolactone decarboxylase